MRQKVVFWEFRFIRDQTLAKASCSGPKNRPEVEIFIQEVDVRRLQTSRMDVIKMKNVSKKFVSGSKSQVVLDNFNMTVKRGKM
jgi:hypothetical protein